MPFGVIGKNNEVQELSSDEINIVSQEDSPTFGDVTSAAARQNNAVISWMAKETNLPTAPSAMIYDIDNPDNNLGEQYRGRAKKDGIKDLKDNWKFDVVRNDKQYDALLRQHNMEKKDLDVLSKADPTTSLGLSLLFGVVDLDATMFIPVAKIMKAGRTGKKALDIATDAAKIGGFGAVSSVGAEALLQDTQVFREEEDAYKNAAIGGAILGSVLGGSVSALTTIDFKKNIGSIVREGLDPTYKTADSSVGAAEVPKTTLEQEGRELPNMAATLVDKYLRKDRLVTDNKVAQLQGAMSRASRAWVNVTASSIHKMNKNKEGIPTVKGGALEERLELAQGELMHIQDEYLDFYHRYAYGTERKFGDVTKTEFRDFLGRTPEGKLSYDDFNHEVSKAAISDDFYHPIPEVSQMAKKLHNEVYSPVRDDLVDLGIFTEDVTVSTAANYMSRIWNKDFIKQRPEVADELFFQEYKASQESNRVLQDQIIPKYDIYEELEAATKSRLKQIGKREKTDDRLTTQVTEGFRYLKDIRKRQGIGSGIVDRARQSFDDIKARIFESEGMSDKIVKDLNSAFGEKLPQIDKKLRDLFRSKKQSLQDEKYFNEMLLKARKHKAFTPSVKYPVMYYFKGMIHPQGDFAKELKALDITPKTFPAYFSNNGYMSLDNIPRGDFPELDNILPRDSDTGNYFDQAELLEAIDSEVRGEPYFYADKDMASYEKWQEVDGFVTELKSRGIDIDNDNVFELYQRSTPLQDDDVARTLDDLEKEIDDIDFYDRASKLLPSLRNDINSAMEKIAEIPALKKLGLDKDLRELKSVFDDIEANISKDRGKLKESKGRLSKAEREFQIKEKERIAFDKAATKRAKNRTYNLIKRIKESRGLQAKQTADEYNLAKLREEMIELSKGWQSQTGFSMAKKSDLTDAEFHQLMRTIRETEMLSDAHLRSIAGETRNIIIKDSRNGALPYERYINPDGTSRKNAGGDNGFRNVSNVPSALMHRSLLIPDKKLQAAGLLNTNAMEVAKRHYSQTVPFVKWYQHTDGDVDLVNLRKDIERDYEEYIRAKNLEETGKLTEQDKYFLGKFSEEQKKYYRNTTKEKITKDKDNDHHAVLTIRDMALGVHGASLNPDSGLVRLSRTMRNYNVITKMGGIVTSSLADLAKLMVLNSPLSKGVIPIIKAMKKDPILYKMKKKELARFFGIFELIRNAKLSQMADIADQYKPKTKVERGVQYMADKFGYFTGITLWNDFLKTVAAISYEDELIAMSRVLRSGKAEQKIIEHLAQANIDKDLAERIINQFDKYGYKSDTGINVLNAVDWDDIEARTALGSAVLKRVNTIMQTPGFDKPALMYSNEAWKALGQFKGFFINSTDRVLFHSLQNIDNPKQVASLISMIGIGMIIYAIKTAQAGREISDNPGTLLIEGMDRGGIFGIFMEYNNILDKVGVGARRMTGGEAPSRYASRSVADSAMGPNFSMMVNILKLMGALGQGELTEGNINTILGLVPGQNQPLVRHLIRNPLKENLGGG